MPCCSGMQIISRLYYLSDRRRYLSNSLVNNDSPFFREGPFLKDITMEHIFSNESRDVFAVEGMIESAAILASIFSSSVLRHHTSNMRA